MKSLEDFEYCGQCETCGESVDLSDMGCCKTCDGVFHWGDCGTWAGGDHCCNSCMDAHGIEED